MPTLHPARASFAMDAPDFASGTEPPHVGLFLLALDPAAFAPDYLQRVEGHFQRLHVRYGIDFGRYLPHVQRMQLADHVYDRLTASARHHHTPEGDIHACAGAAGTATHCRVLA